MSLSISFEKWEIEAVYCYFVILFLHGFVSWNRLFINYCQSCDSLRLSDNPKTKWFSFLPEHFFPPPLLFLSMQTHPIQHIRFSFRPPSSSLSAWTECSTSLTLVSSHHRIPWGPCGLWCCLSHGLCLP